MLLWTTIIFSFAISIGEGWLLYQASRRLLQFDDLFQGIISILDGYSTDLVRMTSSDLDSVLTDHPEVMAFHMRNMRARLEVQNALDTIAVVTPRRRKASALPRPDME